MSTDIPPSLIGTCKEDRLQSHGTHEGLITPECKVLHQQQQYIRSNTYVAHTEHDLRSTDVPAIAAALAIAYRIDVCNVRCFWPKCKLAGRRLPFARRDSLRLASGHCAGALLTSFCGVLQEHRRSTALFCILLFLR